MRNSSSGHVILSASLTGAHTRALNNCIKCVAAAVRAVRRINGMLGSAKFVAFTSTPVAICVCVLVKFDLAEHSKVTLRSLCLDKTS